MTYEIVSKRQKNHAVPVLSPADAFNLLQRYRNARQEQFLVITLDGAHKPITISLACIGLVNRTLIHPREVFIRAIQDMATAIIVCHNHPSGSLRVSPEDTEITEQLCTAGELLGIRVVDHIIFTNTGYMSLRAEGYYKPRKEE